MQYCNSAYIVDSKTGEQPRDLGKLPSKEAIGQSTLRLKEVLESMLGKDSCCVGPRVDSQKVGRCFMQSGEDPSACLDQKATLYQQHTR